MTGVRALRVAVDFGTSSTCVAVSRHGEDPQVVVIDGQPLLRSSVYAAADGTLFVGQEAERQAAVDPSRYEPYPKRRVDEGELLLGTTVLPVTDAFRAVLSRAVGEARRFAGGAEAGLLVLTHPADWGVVRTRTLRQAAAGLAHEVTLLPEPVAAAVFHTATFSLPDGQPGGPASLAVLDLGGGTVDVSVVSGDDQATAGFRVLATKGDPGFGGADIDQALLEHIGSRLTEADADAWQTLMAGRELADQRRRRVLRQDVRNAKETLSRHAYADVPMPQPFADAHVTRQDLERLVAEPLGRTVALTAAAISEAGLRPEQLSGIFLVGGSSRIPMVGRLVHERLGVVPTTLDQPETVVARGALLSAPATPRRVTAAPATVAQPRPAPQPVAAPWQPPPGQPPTRRRRALPWLLAAAAVVLIAAAAAVALWPRSSTDALVARFDYRFGHPPSWTQTDLMRGERRVIVRPSGAPDGANLISVQQFRLSYDYENGRERFLRELHAGLAETGRDFTGFDADFRFADRPVIHYTELATDTTVEWFVVGHGHVQVSVGCRWTSSGKTSVERACEQVIRTLRITAPESGG
ncbi:MAG: type VII secretion-associated protein [Actinophytocola sp.]|nr:type VII secretion-associated protein [Actinophytocola sp.]